MKQQIHYQPPSSTQTNRLGHGELLRSRHINLNGCWTTQTRYLVGLQKTKVVLFTLPGGTFLQDFRLLAGSIAQNLRTQNTTLLKLVLTLQLYTNLMRRRLAPKLIVIMILILHSHSKNYSITLFIFSLCFLCKIFDMLIFYLFIIQKMKHVQYYVCMHIQNAWRYFGQFFVLP